MEPVESALQVMNARSRAVFQTLVDAYMETGQPVGSKMISARVVDKLSPATIRAVMADLEATGLLYAPHTSAGRLPTVAGLRVFVNGLLEISGSLDSGERASIDSRCAVAGRSFSEVLNEATTALSGLSRQAGLVVAPKVDSNLKHIEFVQLDGHRALVVMVSANGQVENRIIEVPPGTPPAALAQASNFLNAQIGGHTLDETRQRVKREIASKRAQLDSLTSRLVADGLALWSDEVPGGTLIVRGQSQLLSDITAITDLERIRHLFEALETEACVLNLIEQTTTADGVQIFIGAEHELFRDTGCSLVISPYRDREQNVVGAIGVIGPSHMNYARIIPMVDYTAQAISKLLD
ncbi:MAG: heat-inducible transcriptional repressor HrcA [Pseudomonadota bacterium]|nr:heat-inducible transcriptional repressor HrcA [Pseudomonadota bacterium]